MSNAELESLIVLYLEGTASRQQVIRLRDAIKSSPEMHQRFQARLRLHRAQMAYLAKQEGRSPRQAMLWLHAFAQRVGRSFAHLCLLALVFVELQVRLPDEVSGLVLFTDISAVEEMPEMGDMPALADTAAGMALVNVDLPADFELPKGDVHDMVVPHLAPPDLLPSVEPSEPSAA
ncbi:hypothetical protein EBR16_03355 [bacterium]|jgi:hypothetical protein|nr:hypothetical protein [bacterium]